MNVRSTTKEGVHKYVTILLVHMLALADLGIVSLTTERHVKVTIYNMNADF